MDFAQFRLDLTSLSDISAQLLTRPPLAVALTVIAFAMGLTLQKRWPKVALFNPTLIAIILVSLILKAAEVPYGAYLTSAQSINFMLAPTVVLLAVPVYRNRLLVRRSWKVICLGVATGASITFLGTLLIARLSAAKAETLYSLFPKSVTTGIAVGISDKIGGVPALTAVFVIFTGIVGAIFGPSILKFLRVEDDRAAGLAIGISAHGIGTAKALQMSEIAGTFSGIGMALNGIVTAIALPLCLTFARLDDHAIVVDSGLAGNFFSPLQNSVLSMASWREAWACLHDRFEELLAAFCFIFAAGVMIGLGLFGSQLRDVLSKMARWAPRDFADPIKRFKTLL